LPDRLVSRARAKVNLALDVVGRRPDGYHELDTIFQELDLADEVELLPGELPGVDVSGPYASCTPGDATNLAWRALEAAAAVAGMAPAFRVRLRKEIPCAAGLGGGSSDAAAVLRLAARRWPHIAGELPRLALELGSDVPFFLRGGTARGRGRGELLEPVGPLPPHAVVLFPTGGEAVSPEGKTGAVFAALGDCPPRPAAAQRVFEAVRSGRVTTVDLAGANALEPAALRAFPALAAHRRRIEAAIGQSVVLTGAGPTWFWIGPAVEADDLVARARGGGLSVSPTRTADAP
jgi:4-diphosphocytidyl-2-C-methyl-D-erythritol kinase